MVTDKNPGDGQIAGRVFSFAWLSLMISGAVLLFGSAAASAFASALKNSGSSVPSSPWFSRAVQIVVMYCLGIPAALLFLRRLPATPPEKRSPGFSGCFRFFLACFPVLVLGSVLGNVLSFVLSRGSAVNPVERITGDLNPFNVLTSVVLAPFFEELLFRRFLIDRTAVFGERAAIVFSAVAFGLFHGNLFQFFYAAGIGLLLGLLYVRTGRLIYTVTLHSLINLIGAVISPLVMQETAPPWARAVYFAVYAALTVAGTVVFIRGAVRLKFKPAPLQIEPSAEPRTVFLNAPFFGFLIYSAFRMITSLSG